eukprot:gene1516-32894_t
MAHHELSPVLSKFLDKHLVFPLLEFLQEKGIYEEKDIMQSKLSLLSNTNMVDFAMDIHKMLHNTEEVPQAMKEHRTEVVARLRQLQVDVDPIIKCLENPAVIRNFRQDKAFNLQFLLEDFQIGPDQVEALYQYAKFQFDCGNYSTAAELLQPYRTLCINNERNMSALNERKMSAPWGKPSSAFLMQNFEAARDDINKLKEAIDQQTFAAPLQQLQQRTWLLHWSLFVFWNHESGLNDLIDLFLSAPYLAAIQINAPHLLRYLATAVVINKRRRNNVLKEVIKIIQQEGYQYNDPVTKFLESLYVNYDFEGAQQCLKECEGMIDNDFFLTACRGEFIENSRLFIFETYCRIHQCIDIKSLAEQLNMDLEAAEKWITNLILDARLNAKIDSKAGTVVMGSQAQSVHEQLTDKAKELSVRTFVLANSVVGGGKA